MNQNVVQNDENNPEEELKHCKDCDQDLPRSSFHKNGKTLMPTCKSCRQKSRSKQNNPRKEGTKFCPPCGIEHLTKEFDSDKSQPDGLQSYCKKVRHERRLVYLSTYDGFIKNLFKDLRSNAKKRKIQVNITLQDIKDLYISQNKQCAISKITMTHQATDRKEGDQHILNKWNISVDRIDSKKPYTKDNIQLVCAIINRLKMSLSDEDFLFLCGCITQTNFTRHTQFTLSSFNKQIVINNQLNKSIISDILTQESEKQMKNRKLDTWRQKWICSIDGFLKKLYLSTRNNLKKRAKDLAFTITEEDIKELYNKQNGKCAISNIKMTYIGYQCDADDSDINNWNISIDRIDATNGYTKDNIQLLCTMVNRMKTDLDNHELFNVCAAVSKTNFLKINTTLIKRIFL